MKKFKLVLFVLLTLSFSLQSQVLLQEDFESGGLPAGWTIQTNATDGGWMIGTPAQVSSQFWGVSSNGSSRVAATNDDACNCDKSEDYLVTPPVNLTGIDIAVVQFDMYFGAQSYQGDTEEATVVASTDGVNWQVLENLHGHDSWDKHVVSLNDFAGDSTVYVGFRYNDNGGWLYGLAVDNISVEVPVGLDAELVKLEGRSFGEEDVPFPIKGLFFNNGGTPIDELLVSYSIGGGAPVEENFTGLDIEPFTYFEQEIPTPWVPDETGVYEITMEIISVNGETDANADNNSGTFETEIFPQVTRPNRIDEFLSVEPVFEEVSVSGTQLDKPTDLAFFPVLAKDELWIVNQRTENSGGSTHTIYNATSDDPEFLHRVDGNAWHFMSLPTALDFSPDNFNFATSPGVQDANHSGGTFTGPTLWSSDPEVYAQPSGGNGSHLDMLHGSPYSMGIAHEVDNVFWVYDDWNSDIVRYDFVDDHGPGNDDHSDAIVRRYKNTGIFAVGGVPNHMILDKATGWLYMVDNGNKRVTRLDINSGSFGGNLPLINEPLTEHSEIMGFTIETIIDEGLDTACGIEIIENRLLVGDYTTGEIIVYDMENDFVELGRIATGKEGLAGITIGPDGSIWYVNRLQNSLVRMEPGQLSSTGESAFASQVRIAPNPTSGKLLLNLPEQMGNEMISLQLSDLTGKKHLFLEGVSASHELYLGDLADGLYLLTIQTEASSVTKKVVIKK